MADPEAPEMEGKLGTVHVAPQVLATIARMTTLSVPGVVRLYHDLATGFDGRLKRRTVREGVSIEVTDNVVSVDVYIVAGPHTNLYELGKAIQSLVARAIQELVGMPVLAVNVHVQDVQNEPTEE
jgi:uncharacterized alkaline shock family protein YloU